MNASQGAPLYAETHGPDCGCDDCRQVEHDALLIASTSLLIADYASWRAGTYPENSESAQTARALADAIRRGAWRRQ